MKTMLLYSKKNLYNFVKSVGSICKNGKGLFSHTRMGSSGKQV